jgi:lipoprotein-anchoring transpeptidase ErfK/SrfK
MSRLSKAFIAGAAALVATATMPASASAQDLISFLWGGDQEHGGGRKTVSFSSQYKPGQIIVSFGDRRLYHVVKAGQAVSYPIAVPREQSRWQGTTAVSMKRENPAWTPTPTMRAENPRLPTYVPGGHPLNPLGVRALYLGSSTYRIHGTDAPWTIGQAVSKGCIRMYNEDVKDLYPKVPVGTRVTVTWQRFNSEVIAAAEPASATAAAADPQGNRYEDAARRAAERRARYESRAYRSVSRSRSASIN